MSFKTTAVLFGLLLAMLWIFGLVLTWTQTRLDTELVIPSLKEKTDIETVTVKRGGKEFQFDHNKEGKWVLRILPHTEDLRVDEDKVDSLISQIRNAKKAPDADVDRKLSNWGLDKPTATITLKNKAGKEWTLNVGNETPDRKGFVYLNSSDRPKDVLAVPRTSVNQVLVDNIHDFRQFKLLDLTDTNATSISVQDLKDKKKLALKKSKDSGWEFEEPRYGPADLVGSAKDKGPSGVKGLILSAGAIRIPTDKDFEPLGGKSGLDEKDALYRIDVVRTAGGFGKQDETVKETLLIGPKTGEKDKEQYLVRMGDEQATAKVGAKQVEAVLEFLKNPISLRSHDLTQISPTRPDVVEVAVGKDLIYLLKTSPTTWEVASGAMRHKANTEEIEGAKGLLATLEGKEQVKDFFDPANADDAKKLDAKLGFDKSAFKVTVFLDAFAGEVKKEEPKDKKDEPKDKKDDKKDEGKAKQEPGKDKKDDPKGKPEEGKDKKEDKGKLDDGKDKKDDGKAKKDEPKEKVLPGGFKMKEEAKPAVTLIFGDKAGDKVYVKRISADGVETRLTVSSNILEKALPAQGALAYFDNKLAPFEVEDVAKLELVRASDGAKFVVERKQPKAKEQPKDKDGKDKEQAKDKDKELGKDKDKDQAKEKDEFGTWTLVEPQDLPGRTTTGAPEVMSLLFGLEDLTAKKWVKQIGPKDDLKEFGLDKPFLTATVTFKKKEGDKTDPVPLVYKFGGKTTYDKDKTAYYAVQSGDLKDFVFTVTSEAIKPLEDAELRDRTVLKFDADKAKELKATIVTKSETRTLVFARDGRNWIFKTPDSKINLDPEKVEDLVKGLSTLRADKYVIVKGGPQPAQELGDKAALKFEVLMDDGKTTHTLNIGAATGKSYFADSNALPGVVFLVGEGRFKPILDGVAYFTKN